ncbi:MULTISPECIES: DUF308 domain-containing protein [unclassified Brevibacterium]|uniref:HdeD family acid-resistance protein n=1 Tax=unclassified Brevibacterium TaxID=2614124 RepID=UPI0010F5008D|nr:MULTISPECIES: DUF308 domain-containing protein [unclassified Brevibacterium]MCM1012983.1 DUF308 domain-containing protein [Brevibacterium sp. XM4083]
MDLKRTGTAVIVNGVIALAVGVLMMVWPGATAEVVARIFACWVALIAITSLVLAPRGTRGGGRILRTILMLAFAVIVFLAPMLFAAVVTVLAGLTIIAVSTFGIGISVFVRQLGVRAWWLLTIISVVGIVIGGFFLFAPEAGIAALVVTLSIFIALVGIALVWLGWRLRKLEARIAADPRINRRGDGGGEIISGEVIE